MNWKKVFTIAALTGFSASVATGQGTAPTIVQGDYITNVFGNSNFIKNPNAKLNNKDVTVSNATVTRSTATPLVATSEFTITTSTATGFATWSTRTFDGGMKGQNCEARFTYRGFSVGSTTAQILQGSNVVAQLTLTPSTDPRIASINFPCGDLSTATTFRLQQATASLTGTNEIGAVYVGLATNQANVAQAELVGGGEWTTSTGFTRSSSAIQSTFAAFTSGSAGTAVGKATSAGSDTTITFPYLPAGQYYVSANFYNYLYFGGVINANCEFTIQEIDSNTNSGISSTGAFSITTIYPPASQLQGNFNFTTGGQRRFRIVSRNTIANGASSLCVSLPDASVKAGIYVYRFPSSSELVVTPERQNVFGGVEWSAAADWTGTATSYTTINVGSAWGSPVTFGSATAAGTSCGLAANDVGFCIDTLPPGTYKIGGNFQLGVVPSVANNFCAYSANIGGGTLTDNRVIDALPRSAASSAAAVPFINLGSGLFKVTSLQRNVRVWLHYRKDATATRCEIRADNTNYYAKPSLHITPVDQPSNSALYVQGPVLGAQTGAAIPAGYAGYTIESTLTGTTTPTNSNQWYTTESVSLTPGVWSCYADSAFYYAGAGNAPTGFTAFAFGICSGVNCTPSSIVSVHGANINATGNGSDFGAVLNHSRIFNVSSTTTYYLSSKFTFTARNGLLIDNNSSTLRCTLLN